MSFASSELPYNKNRNARLLICLIDKISPSFELKMTEIFFIASRTPEEVHDFFFDIRGFVIYCVAVPIIYITLAA